MGWAYCGEDSTGRAIGYGVAATCDHPGCEAQINRGLAYACGEQHGSGEHDCEGYFCAEHRYATTAGFLCRACADRWASWVCDEIMCQDPASGTVVRTTDRGRETVRLCAHHGAERARLGDRYVPDEAVRVLRAGDGWDVTDGWDELKTARDAKAMPVRGTDRATGDPVWVTLADRQPGTDYTVLVDARPD